MCLPCVHPHVKPPPEPTLPLWTDEEPTGRGRGKLRGAGAGLAALLQLPSDAPPAAPPPPGRVSSLRGSQQPWKCQRTDQGRWHSGGRGPVSLNVPETHPISTRALGENKTPNPPDTFTDTHAPTLRCKPEHWKLRADEPELLRAIRGIQFHGSTWVM